MGVRSNPLEAPLPTGLNGIERAPRSNLARLPAISSFWTLPKESHALVFHEGHSTAAVHVQLVTPTFATSFDSFIPTYHSLYVCSCQALFCVRLAACRVPLV